MLKRFACIILSLSMLFAFCVLPVSSLDRATLFINDVPWEEDSLLPFIESNGKMLLPALAFAKFPSITVTRSDTLGSLLIEGEEKYLSFNLNFGTCIDKDQNVTKCDVFRYGGEIYLEPYMICDTFNLTFETEFAPDGFLAARLRDGEASVEFGTLLTTYSEDGKKDLPFLYNPTGKTLPGSFVHPILLVPSLSNAEIAINLLGDHRSTFALSPSEIEKYVSLLPKIYAAGHTVAYYMDFISDTDAAVFKAQMDKANEYLFSVTGKTSRIYVSAVDIEHIPSIDGYFAKSCGNHLVVDDIRNDRLINLTLWVSPSTGVFNFSLASDKESRTHYGYFFSKFDTYEAINSMPLTESSSIK